MMKISFTEENQLTILFQDYKTTINLDPKIFPNCDQYIARIQEFDLEKLSIDDLAEINKIVHELRNSLTINTKKKNPLGFQSAFGETTAAITLFKVSMPYISGGSSGAAFQEAANC